MLKHTRSYNPCLSVLWSITFNFSLTIGGPLHMYSIFIYILNLKNKCIRLNIFFNIEENKFLYHPQINFPEKSVSKFLCIFSRSFPVHIQINSKFTHLCVWYVILWLCYVLFSIVVIFFTKYILLLKIYLYEYGFFMFVILYFMYNYSFFHLTVWVFCFTMSIIHTAMSILNKLCILRQNS